MAETSIHAAKTQLSKLIARAQAGEEVIICKGKTPVARLTAIKPPASKRRFGAYRGRATVTGKFFDPLPEAELRAFEGRGRGKTSPR